MRCGAVMYDNINFTIPTDILTFNLIWGMRTILKYQPNARIHDTLYFGDINSTERLKISEEDETQMISWGW